MSFYIGSLSLHDVARARVVSGNDSKRTKYGYREVPNWGGKSSSDEDISDEDSYESSDQSSSPTLARRGSAGINHAGSGPDDSSVRGQSPPASTGDSVIVLSDTSDDVEIVGSSTPPQCHEAHAGA